MSKDFDVIINGGGPVGMGLAIELGQRGIRTCVVERYPEPQPIPKGQNLTQRSCEHFRAWNCEDEVRAAHPIPRGSGIGGMTSYGALLSDYHYDWLNREHVRDYYFTANARLPQYATERALRARAKALKTVTIHYGWSGETLTETADGVRLGVRAVDGARTATMSASYLVGCDGSRSVVRDSAGITETRSEHSRLMALVVFRSEELHELLKRYPGKAFYCVLHPDLDGYWRFFGRVDHGHSWFFHAPVPRGTTAENFDFRELLHISVGQPFDLEIDHIGLWDLRISLADAYRKGRVFIAGDAAHSHPPYGGYGINTGFEDVRNLGWKLAATLKGWGGTELLDSYEAERRPVFASTARDFIGRYIEDDRAFLKAYDPELNKQAFETAWYGRNLDSAEVDAFEPHYEGSPIIGGTGAPSARGQHGFRAVAGHHLPPPGAGMAKKAADLLGPDFTLLTAAPAGASGFEASAATRGIPLTLRRIPAAWAETYGAQMVLVRPDGYVAWAGDSVADARAVLGCATGFGCTF